MTDAEKLAERLKVAEEIVSAIGFDFFINDISVRKGGPGWIAFHRGSIVRELASSKSPIDAIIAARAKLREEAEAAMTPRERVYKAALEEISRLVFSYPKTAELARKALEQGAT